MSCTAEQIAEKKRIAQERLRLKQQQLATVRTSSSTATTTSLPQKPAVAPPPQKPQPTNNNNAGGPASANSASKFLAVNSFYSRSSSPPVSSGGGGANGSPVRQQQTAFAGGGKMRSSPAQQRHQPYGAKPSTTSNGQRQPQSAAEAPKLAPVFLPTKTAVCSMINAERFVVDAPFHQAMIDVFKSVPSREFDTATKNWTFHIDDYQLLRDRMQPLQSDVQLTHLPAFVLRLFGKPTTSTTTGPSSNGAVAAGLGLACLKALEPHIAAALLPFQKLGVCFGIEKQGRCMIADEMGLGKTYQALALADFYKNDWPLLVCTTAATRDAWVQTVRTLMPYVAPAQVCCLTGIGRSAQLADAAGLASAQVLVVSYNLMERNSEQLLRRRFPFVILDESHLLKNVKAKSTRAALELSRLARRVVLLTGTPALSRPSELFTQLQIIDPKFFTFMDYSTRYCAGKQTNFGWDASGQSHLAELNAVLQRRFMIRRTKDQVLFDLGAKSRETVMLDRALISTDGETKENMESYAADVSNMSGRQREEVLFQYYRETAQAKAPAVCAYLRGLVRDDEKFIVFAHHRAMLDAIEECLRKERVEFVRIDGRTQNDTRTKHVNRFQTDTKCRVAVLSLKACNAGITLTATQLVVFAELDWNPSTLAQAESRAHRIGQTGEVRCRYLLAQGTADDVIWRMLQDKQQTLNKAGLFSDDLADGALKQAPTISKKITGYLERSSGSKEDVPAAAAEDVLSEFLDDDDDLDFGQIEM